MWLSFTDSAAKLVALLQTSLRGLLLCLPLSFGEHHPSPKKVCSQTPLFFLLPLSLLLFLQERQEKQEKQEGQEFSISNSLASGFCGGLLFENGKWRMENGKLRCASGANLITRRRSLLHNFQLSIFNFQFPKRVHIARRVQGLVLILLRSLLNPTREWVLRRGFCAKQASNSAVCWAQMRKLRCAVWCKKHPQGTLARKARSTARCAH